LKSILNLQQFYELFPVTRLFTNGKTAAFVGATTEGNFSTVLVDPSSKVLKKLQNCQEHSV
jgi:hypothetical protein